MNTQDKVYHRRFVPNLQNKIPMNQTGETIHLNDNKNILKYFITTRRILDKL